ncbi:MAG: DNA-methyltransferase [Candidatus Thorarchaeota archaeon]
MRTELEKQDTKLKKKAKSTSYPERQLAKMLKGRPLEIPKTNHHLIIGDSRQMQEIPNESVHLIVTSPPYPMIELWDDLFSRMGCTDFDTMHVYLAQVWSECYRILVEGGIACINIGDALRKIDDNFQLYPNHVKVIEHCEALGFTTLPYILWKKPTKRANAFLGSGFIPPNAYVTQDCEFILIFRKGQPRPFPPKDLIRYASQYTISQRNAWFTQIWELPGARQRVRQVSRRSAAFPDEIAYRLIRMFSVIGDTVVDPFLGTGTTMKAARKTHRNSIGYEIDERLIPVIERRFSDVDSLKPRQRRKAIEELQVTHRND